MHETSGYISPVLNTIILWRVCQRGLYVPFILVWVAVSMEAYLLVDFSVVLQKQQTSITEDSSHTKIDMMAIEEIFKTIVTPHISFLVGYLHVHTYILPYLAVLLSLPQFT
jgi:hypothetical protein